MFNNRELSEDILNSKAILLKETLEVIYTKIFDGKQIKNISKTILEGLLYGISKNIERLKLKSNEEILILYNQF